MSDYLCGFRNGYSTQYSLIFMIEKWKKAVDQKKVAGAVLTDLSKAFDCLNHELLIAKLAAYGLDQHSLRYILSYLTGRKQRTKINYTYSSWSSIKCGVPQGSNLGPLLFNIYINDIFYFVNGNNLTNYADDNTPYAICDDVNSVIKNLENQSSVLQRWFTDNYFKMNSNKCKLIITDKHEHTANINGVLIKGDKTVKLLGVTIDNNLNFNGHINDLCRKANQKFLAIARISNYIDNKKLRILMKAFIESQFGYCPLLWMFHSRALNNKIDKLHERSLRILYKGNYDTFSDLLKKDNSFSIHQRNLQKLVIEMFKVRNGMSPLFMKEIFPTSEASYNFRHGDTFCSNNIRTVKCGKNTISHIGPRIWVKVPINLRKIKSLEIFKKNIRNLEIEGCPCSICKEYIHHFGFC